MGKTDYPAALSITAPYPAPCGAAVPAVSAVRYCKRSCEIMYPRPLSHVLELAILYRASIDPWPKFRSAHLFPWSATCWGVPSPNPADRRSAPVLWRSRATKIRQPRLLRSRLTRRKSEAVSAIAAERRTRRNSTPALRLYCSIGPIRQN